MKKLFTLMMLCAVAVVANASKNVYLTPGVWNVDGARYALYMFSDGETYAWADFAAVDGEDGVFCAAFDEAYAKMILVRMNGEAAENNWDNKWNQSADLDAPAEDVVYNITDWDACTSFPYSAITEGKALAADEDAVAVGKLQAALKAWTGVPAAIEQFKADNADQEKDETAKVATNGWKNFKGEAAGVCATQYAPAINTYDGRTNVQLAEVYEGSTDGVNRTGTIIYQDITGLENGTYKVGFYGNAFFTSGRGFDSPMTDGAEDVAYVFANEAKEFIVANIATSTTENNFRQFDVEVTDGTIRLGMGKDKAGTNWHTMQIYQLTWFTTAKAVYAADKEELSKMLFGAAAELDNANKTEGKEELRAALDAAQAAYESNMLNIPELEAEMAKLKAAVAAYMKANYYIDFAAGQYYVIDAESGLMMAAGHDWGTRGIVNEPGLDLTLTPYEQSRTVTFDSRVSNGGDNHFLGVNLFMDSSSWGWALEYQGFGFYIKDPDGGKYINIDYDNNLVLSDTPREFILVSADGVYQARMEEMKEATKDDPKDATFLLKHPNFNRNDQRVEAWEWSPMGDAESNPDFWNNHNFNGGNNVNNCAESYHAAFTVRQTVSNVPAGFYSMTAQGFYRQDNEAEEAAPQFFANGVNQDVPVKTGEESSMSAASESFTSGLYTIEPINFEVTEDGMLYVGLYTEAIHQWVIWDNFQLLYYGTENPTTAISEVNAAEQTSTAVYNLAGQQVMKAQKGLFIVNGKKVVK